MIAFFRLYKDSQMFILANVEAQIKIKDIFKFSIGDLRP